MAHGSLSCSVGRVWSLTSGSSVQGWGSKCKQVYIPSLQPEALRVHRHYKKIGVAHVYQGTTYDTKQLVPPESTFRDPGCVHFV